MPDSTDRAHDVLAAEAFALPAPDPTIEVDKPTDILAAEGFVVPAPDPRLGAAHDVLAAEEFVVPAPDPVLTVLQRPLRLPAPPLDQLDTPAHDILAAEEFAVPAATRPGSAERPASSRGQVVARILVGTAAMLTCAVLLRRRGRH